MSDEKITVLIGASENSARYANLAVRQLKRHGHKVVPIGLRQGFIEDIPIIVGKPELKNVDTVTLYLNKTRQQEYQDFILNLHPKRIIFNPGAENPVLGKLATEKGIEPLEACTLVMLSTGQY
jgi:predicted CoA-binding protein